MRSTIRGKALLAGVCLVAGSAGWLTKTPKTVPRAVTVSTTWL